MIERRSVVRPLSGECDARVVLTTETQMKTQAQIFFGDKGGRFIFWTKNPDLRSKINMSPLIRNGQCELAGHDSSQRISNQHDTKVANAYAVDLFAGAGGMSVGARQGGLRVAYSVEVDPNAAATYSWNHPETNIIQRDVRTVTADDFRERPNRRVDILFGGPPCQGFSTSNQKTRSSANPSNWLFTEYVRLVREMEPNWVIFENVKGLIETEQGFFFRTVKESFSSLGYTVTALVLNAADYGVPQRRERLFVVGSRKGCAITQPPKRRAKKVTVRDAIADLPSLKIGSSIDYLPYKRKPDSAYAEQVRGGLYECGNHFVSQNAPEIARRYHHVPQGGNWENIPAKLMTSYADRTRCHTGIYYRLREDAPSIVVGNFRKNMLIHPWEDRGLSVREAARLQSFPDSYRFYGSIGFQQQQVGNAVPPLLAKALFTHILDRYT